MPFGALGLCRSRSSYEGQVAVAWDFVASDDEKDACYPFEIDRGQPPMQIDLRKAVRAQVDDLRDGVPPSVMSARFHGALVGATTTVVGALLADHGSLPVVLTGGVFQNARD